jgi:hypothetical protein
MLLQVNASLTVSMICNAHMSCIRGNMCGIWNQVNKESMTWYSLHDFWRGQIWLQHCSSCAYTCFLCIIAMFEAIYKDIVHSMSYKQLISTAPIHSNKNWHIYDALNLVKTISLLKEIVKLNLIALELNIIIGLIPFSLFLFTRALWKWLLDQFWS